MNKEGVSPVIGIILLTAVTVSLVSLAAFFVFDVGQSSSSGVGTATVKADYESESRIDVQLLKQGSSDKVIVRSALGTEYVLNSTGDSVTLLNQDSNQTPIVLGEKDGERTVLREVPPQSFTPDIVIASNNSQGQYSDISKGLENVQAGDIVVVKKGVYYENIDITTSNVTLVGETGTVISDNGTDNAVVDIKDNGIRVSNIQIDGNSSQGGTAADYGVRTSQEVELASVTISDTGTSDTDGTVSRVSDSQLVSSRSLSDTPRSELLIYGDGNGKVYARNPATDATEYARNDTNLSISPGGSTSASSFAYNEEENVIAYTSADSNAYIYDARTGALITELNFTEASVNSAAWRPDAEQIAFAADETEVYIFDIEGDTYTLNQTLNQSESYVYTVTYRDDGQQIAYGTANHRVHIYDVKSNYSVNTSLYDENFVNIPSVSFSPSDDRLAYTNTNGNVYIYDTSDYSKIQKLSQASDRAIDVTWSQNGEEVAYTSLDSNVYIHNASSGNYELSHNLSTASSGVGALRYSPSDDQLAFTTRGGTVYVFDANPYALNKTYSESSSSSVNALFWKDD